MKGLMGEAKESLWRERLTRFESSGKTVAAFCLAEGLRLPTFYRGKRKLASRSAKRRGRRAETSLPAKGGQAFVPVRIEDAALGEVELPNGARVRVRSNELDVMAAAMVAAGRISAGVETQPQRC